MNVALIVFDNMTALDFVGFYDAVTRLQTMKIQPEFEWTICARQPQVRDDRGLTMAVESVDESLAGSGDGVRNLDEPERVEPARAFHEDRAHRSRGPFDPTSSASYRGRSARRGTWRPAG